MATVTTDKYSPYPRVCDICGKFDSIATMTKLDSVTWVCEKHTGERTRIMLDVLNAHARPPQTWPVKNPKPQDPNYPNTLDYDEGACFAFIDRQIQAQCRYELIVNGSGPYTSAGEAVPTLAWAARYLYGIIVENKRTLLIARAKVLLAQCASFLLSRQYGSSTGPSPASTRDNDAYYGCFLESGATVIVTNDVAAAGLGLLYAYRVFGTLSYLSGARAAASYLRNVQAIGSNGTYFPSSDAGGTARLYTGAVASQVSTARVISADPPFILTFYSNHLFYPSGLVALQFWNELKTTDGDQSIGLTSVAVGFDTVPAQLLSTSIADMRACWTNGIRESTGTVVNGLSSTTPHEYFNAYPTGKPHFANVFGTGRWEFSDGGASTGTQITAQNFSLALSALYAYEGASSQVTTILSWLRSFSSNASFETPANTSGSVLARSTTGTFDSTVALTTCLTVRDSTASYAAIKTNGSSLYDWGAFGVASALLAGTDKTSFMNSRLGALNLRQRYDDGTPNDAILDRIETRGMSGLTYQTAFLSDLSNPDGTQSSSGAAAVSTSPSTVGLVQWVKSDVGLTISPATRASNWADQSGQGQDFRQDGNNPGNAPYVLGDSIDGKPLITFGTGVDANKAFDTAANFKDRNGIDMDGAHARTILTVIKPQFSGAYNRAGGPLWSQPSWVSYFFLDPTGIVGPVNGAYAWFNTSYATANQFTPVSGGSGGPYDGTPLLTEYFSSGRPDLEFRINNTMIPLTPTTMDGAAGGAAPAHFSDSNALAFLGGVTEILVYDYDLRTDPTSYTQTISYIGSRYASLSLTHANLALTNDGLRAAQYGLSYRQAH